MANAARQQIGLQPEKLKSVYKNEHMPSHDLCIGQDVMFQDVTSKQWYPATFISLCVQARGYNETTKRWCYLLKTQAYLKPYKPHCKKAEDEHSDSGMQTLKS